MASELDPEILQNSLKAIADAELYCHRSRMRKATGVSAVAQKAALVVLLAHEGEIFCNQSLADRIGIATCNVAEVIGSLMEQGFIHEIQERRDRRRYAVDVAALKARASRSPLWKPRRYGPRSSLTGVVSDGLLELRRVMQSVGLSPEEAADIRGPSRARGIVAKRMKIVRYLRDSLHASFPKIALMVRGDAAKHPTCFLLYKRAKRTG